MKLFFAIVYIRIITLTMIFDDHPLVEYPLFKKKEKNLSICRNWQQQVFYIYKCYCYKKLIFLI